jgi:hypothetical protein
MQIENRLGRLPVKINKSFIIHAALDDEFIQNMESLISKIYCKTSPGILLETPPLRILSDGSIYWRAKLTGTGTQFIKVGFAGMKNPIKKKIKSVYDQEGFSPKRTKSNSLDYFLNSAEAPIPSDSALKFLSVNYLPATYPFLYWDISPVIYFFILTIVIGLIIKPFMRVNI